MKTTTVRIDSGDPGEYAEKYVKAKGARRKLGAGCYGAVWGSNEGKRGSGRRVYKIGNISSNRDAYLAYALACANELKGNPFVPRIYSIIYIESVNEFLHNSNVFIVCMEQLVPAGEPNGNPLNGCDCDISEQDKMKMETISNAIRNTDVASDTSQYRKNNMPILDPKLEKVIHTIAKIKANNDRCLDIHSANVMKRGNIMVITDPLS